MRNLSVDARSMRKEHTQPEKRLAVRGWHGCCSSPIQSARTALVEGDAFRIVRLVLRQVERSNDGSTNH